MAAKSRPSVCSSRASVARISEVDLRPWRLQDDGAQAGVFCGSAARARASLRVRKSARQPSSRMRSAASRPLEKSHLLAHQANGVGQGSDGDRGQFGGTNRRWAGKLREWKSSTKVAPATHELS
jgi:hypothetical protein